MKKFKTLSASLITFFLLGDLHVYAQNVAINATGAAPAASAMLDVTSTTMGFLAPRMTSAQRTAIGTPATGLLVYDTTVGAFYWYDGTAWRMIVGGNTGWLLAGNALAGTEFLGSTNAQPVMFRSNNTERMRILSGGQVLVNHTAAVSANPAFESQGTAAFPDAMRAYTAVTTGMGLFSQNNAVAGTAIGFGAFCSSTQTGGDGLAAGLGANSYYAGAGVSAYTINTLAGGRGVLAGCDNATGVGVQGQSTGASGLGVYGYNSGATGFGMSAYNANASGTGIIASGNNLGAQYLVAGSGAAINGIATGIFARSSTAGLGEAVYSNQFGAICRYNYWSGALQYKALSTGAMSVSCSVPDDNGQYRVLHCPETPEYYFMDYGQGKLVNGKAHIDLDPILAKNVAINEKHPLRVYIQIEDDENCKGVVVKNKTTGGFDVVEMQGGNSNATFQWQIVCNVADATLPNGRQAKFSDARFELAPADMQEGTAIQPGVKEAQTLPAEKRPNQ
ncbi:MAG: hypothetical protein FD123_1627 [Bacteroidetes bacterium]|nr:MAG: hypothetical protein FD123_1627 [Bacteroidota bacterium]